MVAKLVVATALLAVAHAGIIGAPLGLAGLGLGAPLGLGLTGLGLAPASSIVTTNIVGPKVLAAPVALASPAVAVSSQSITRTISPQLISAGPAIVAAQAPAVLAAPALVSAGHGAALVGPSAPATKIVGPDGGLIASPGAPGGVVSIGASHPGLIAASAPVGIVAAPLGLKSAWL